MKMAQDIIEEEIRLREKAEIERDQAEYDRNYYARELRNSYETPVGPI